VLRIVKRGAHFRHSSDGNGHGTNTFDTIRGNQAFTSGASSTVRRRTLHGKKAAAKKRMYQCKNHWAKAFFRELGIETRLSGQAASSGEIWVDTKKTMKKIGVRPTV
jgi:hypothetical protein